MSNSDNLAPPEKLLRDKLCQRLDLIESGLTLISKEEYLRNDNGSSGFIDILSRDKFGNLVIIELKRADSPARQAVQELCKYLALMKRNHNIPENRLRCIVVSTTWHELRTPFFEFKNSVQLDVEGYQLFLDASQNPYRCELIEEDANQEIQITICPRHRILIFTNQDTRDSASTDLTTFLMESGISDYCCLILLDYHDSDSSLMFPYVIYYLQNRIPKIRQEEMLESNILKVADYGQGDLPDWQVEEAIMSRLKYPCETGNSERLLEMLNSGWTVSQILRTGHMFHSKTIYRDIDIIRHATGLDGANSIIFSAIGTPRRRPSWANIIEKMKLSLSGNIVWGDGLLWYCDEIAKTYPKATVTIHIYNPLDCIGQLVNYIATNDADYLPYLELTLDDTEQSGDFCRLIGGWIWDGSRPHYAKFLFDSTYGSVANYLHAKTFNETYIYEDAILSKLGLEYSLLEMKFTRENKQTSRRLRVYNEQPSWTSESIEYWFMDFIASTNHFQSSLLTLIRQNSIGI